MATLVKFRKFKYEKDVRELTAVFPQLKYNKRLYGNTMVTGYAHVGQHTGVHVDWLNNDNSEPANESEYQDLKQELESIGYDLKVCK